LADGAITAGMAYEALNQAGHLGNKLIVVLNDNGMSISPTVGAVAKLMSRVRFDKRFRRSETRSKKIITSLPKGTRLWELGRELANRFRLRSTFSGTLGFTYRPIAATISP
jgi:1-deoxy-D-xylulose-5-phosphate synthase